MELLQLKYFCDAAKTQNFSETAKKFGVPASDISQSVKRMEKELGRKLFSRSANRITINSDGWAFFENVSSALAIIDSAVSDVSSGIGERLSICIDTNRRIVMQVIEEFKRKKPAVDIALSHFSDVEKEEFDIIIANENSKLSDFNSSLLLREKICLAVSAEGKYALAKSADISSLSSAPFISMSERSSLFDITHRICRDHGFKPHIALTTDDPQYVRKCVELGIGVAFVPSFSWQGQFSDKVHLFTLDGYVRDTFVYTRKRRRISNAASEFIKMLVDTCHTARMNFEKSK